MKKFLLSFLCFLLAVGGGYAEEVTESFTFSNFTAGTQYAQNEEHKLSDAVTIYTTLCHFTTELRIYSSSTNNGYVVSDALPGNITKMTFNAGYKSDELVVYGSNDGETWTEVGEVKVVSASTSTYKDYSLDFSGSYTRFKLDVKGSNQIRLKKMSVTYTTSGSVEPPKETVATPEISFNGATFEESVEVTITAAEGTTAYYTLNGKTPTKDSDECPKILTLKADATLQVIAFDEDGNASQVVKQVFEKSVSSAGGATAGTATLVTDVTNLNKGDQVVIVASDYGYALSTNQRSSNRGAAEVEKDGVYVTLNEDVQILTLVDGGKGNFSFHTGDGYLYAASGSGNQLKTKTSQDDKGIFTIEIDGDGVATIKAIDTSVRNWLRFNENKGGDPLFSCYTSGQQDISLYKVNYFYDFNVSEAGWSTLYLGYNVVIPEDVACYVISEVGEGSVILKEVTGVLPANTAVIVEAAAGTYTFEVADQAEEIENKMLLGTTINQYIAEEAFVLAEVDDEVGLYKAKMMGGVFLNNANKAYLPVFALPESVQNAKALKFNFDTTGVESVKVETAGKKVIYDLSGRRVNEMTQPGIYIVNGKKVMVK